MCYVNQKSILQILFPGIKSCIFLPQRYTMTFTNSFSFIEAVIMSQAL